MSPATDVIRVLRVKYRYCNYNLADDSHEMPRLIFYVKIKEIKMLSAIISTLNITYHYCNCKKGFKFFYYYHF